jgi:hypothetical protein
MEGCSGISRNVTKKQNAASLSQVMYKQRIGSKHRLVVYEDSCLSALSLDTSEQLTLRPVRLTSEEEASVPIE